MKQDVDILKKGSTIQFVHQGTVVAEAPLPSSDVLQEIMSEQSNFNLTVKNGFTKFKLGPEEAKEAAALILMDEMAG